MKTTSEIARAARSHFAHFSTQALTYLDLEILHDRDIDLNDVQLSDVLERRFAAWEAVPADEQRHIRAFFKAESEA